MMHLRWLACGTILLLCVPDAWAREGAWARFESGVKAYQRGEYDVARQRFEAAIQADPAFGDAYYYLGVLLERSGDTRKAVDTYKKVEEKWPTYFLSQERLGQIALKLGEKEAAETYFTVVATHRPTAHAWMQVASVQLDLKKFEPATETLKKAEELAKDDLNLVELWGRLYLETQRFEEALARYETLAKRMPRDANARYLGGCCLLELGRSGEAVDAFEAVLTVDPYHEGALGRLVSAYEGDRDKAGRVKELSRRLELVRNRPPATRVETSGSPR